MIRAQCAGKEERRELSWGRLSPPNKPRATNNQLLLVRSRVQCRRRELCFWAARPPPSGAGVWCATDCVNERGGDWPPWLRFQRIAAEQASTDKRKQCVVLLNRWCMERLSMMDHRSWLLQSSSSECSKHAGWLIPALQIKAASRCRTRLRAGTTIPAPGQAVQPRVCGVGPRCEDNPTTSTRRLPLAVCGISAHTRSSGHGFSPPARDSEPDLCPGAHPCQQMQPQTRGGPIATPRRKKRARGRHRQASDRLAGGAKAARTRAERPPPPFRGGKGKASATASRSNPGRDPCCCAKNSANAPAEVRTLSPRPKCYESPVRRTPRSPAEVRSLSVDMEPEGANRMLDLPCRAHARKARDDRHCCVTGANSRTVDRKIVACCDIRPIITRANSQQLPTSHGRRDDPTRRGKGQSSSGARGKRKGSSGHAVGQEPPPEQHSRTRVRRRLWSRASESGHNQPTTASRCLSHHRKPVKTQCRVRSRPLLCESLGLSEEEPTTKRARGGVRLLQRTTPLSRKVEPCRSQAGLAG